MTARILVVDDIPANVKLLEARLLAEYYDVLTADDGAKALAICENVHVDLVLLDVTLPIIDGFEVCERLRANPRTQNIPIVIVSALDRPSDKVRGLRAGADDFLTKPVNDIQLVARVKSLIRQRRNGSGDFQSFKQQPYSDTIENTARTFPRILLVDGKATSQQRITNVLQSISVVYTVSHPAAALLEAVEQPWDLILVNNNFEDYDPLRFCAQLRSLQQTRHLPILIILDEDAEHEMVRAFDIGVNDYLTRPIDPAELVVRCENLLRNNAVARMRAPMEGELRLEKAIRQFKVSPQPTRAPLIYDVRGNTLEVVDLPAMPIALSHESANTALELILQKGTLLQEKIEHSNIHYRLLEVFRELLAAAHSKQNVISLGLINIECHAVLCSLDSAGEVPAALAGSLKAQCQMVKLYISQFDEWKRFEEQAERKDIGPKKLRGVTEALITLGDDLAKQSHGVDKAVPKSIQFLTSLMQHPGDTSIRFSYAAISTLENICFAVANYCSDFLVGAATIASKQGQKVLGTGVAGAVLTAAVSYAGIIDVASRVPWLNPAIEILKKYILIAAS